MAKFKPKKEDFQDDKAITVRVPLDTYRKLEKYSKREGFKSMNKLVLQMIEHCLEDIGAK